MSVARCWRSRIWHPRNRGTVRQLGRSLIASRTVTGWRGTAEAYGSEHRRREPIRRIKHGFEELRSAWHSTVQTRAYSAAKGNQLLPSRTAPSAVFTIPHTFSKPPHAGATASTARRNSRYSQFSGFLRASAEIRVRESLAGWTAENDGCFAVRNPLQLSRQQRSDVILVRLRSWGGLPGTYLQPKVPTRPRTLRQSQPGSPPSSCRPRRRTGQFPPTSSPYKQPTNEADTTGKMKTLSATI